MTAVAVAVVFGLTDQSLLLHRSYVDCVLAAGGIPILVPAVYAAGDGRLEQALETADVLLLTGGGDIQPRLYGSTPLTTLDHVDPARDDVELRALSWARNAGARVLGICRGAQVLAVANGGSLVQDLPAAGYEMHVDVRHDRPYAGLQHAVKTEPGSVAERLLAGMEQTNSHHHQAVAEVGEGLVATAWSADGVIEAIEGPNVLGVQWHPESAASTDNRNMRPFHWLINGEAEWPA